MLVIETYLGLYFVSGGQQIKLVPANPGYMSIKLDPGDITLTSKVSGRLGLLLMEAIADEIKNAANRGSGIAFIRLDEIRKALEDGGVR